MLTTKDHVLQKLKKVVDEHAHLEGAGEHPCDNRPGGCCQVLEAMGQMKAQ